MSNIIVKRYEHYNRPMGKYIRSKRHYEEETARGGFVSLEKGKELAEKHKRDHYKPYDKPSDKAMGLIRSVADMRPNKDGKIKLYDRQVDAMKKMGVSFDPKFIPKGEGGFK